MTNMGYPFQSIRTCMSNALKGVFALVVVCVQLASGATAPSMTFYVPFPEADALNALDTINVGAVTPITTYVSIAAIADNTIIYFDQWEDGYEKTHHLPSPIQATTQIWGDGNPANGAPPGVPTDLINSGTVILLNNAVDPSNPTALDYDARDKIVSTRVIAVTRTYWAAGSETLMAGSVETYDTSKWGTDYRIPVGQSIPDGASANDGDHQMFEYTALSVMASEAGTTVYIDADSNGSYETTNTLNEGDSTFVDGGVNVGARVTSTKPVQVMIFAGDVGSNYESRDSTILPLSMWSSSYFTPVSTVTNGTGTRVWLYNPGGTTITVNYRYRLGAATGVTTNSTTTVGANAYASVLLPNTAGAEFYTTGSPAPVFYAYSTTDSDNATTTGNQAFDWSYTLIPKQLLTPQVLVGVGMGRDPLSAVNPTENGNPIWVTTVGNGQSNATVYVDFNGDNLGALTDSNGHHYDTNFVARELQPIKIYDPDGDQTAMLIYTLSTNVMLAAAWGQDPLTATAGEPGLDAGTAVPPVDVFDVSKSLTLVNDADGDGQLGPGERVSYEINIGNTSRAPVPADVIVQDVLPEDTTYVAGSSYYRTGTNNAWVAIADDSSGTAFPLDGAGYRIYAAIPVDDFFTVRFQATVDTFANLTAGRASIVNTGKVTAVVYNRTLPFKNETFLHGSVGDRVWNDANGNGVQDVGETGINGVIVYLDSNTNGVRDADERYATTAGNGIYVLTNALIEAGTHLVRVDRSTLASDFLQTYDVDGTNTAHAATVTLLAGQDRTDVDFGYRSPARVGDFVWVDTNVNGQQDIGEPGLSNVVVRLYTNNVLIATTTSSASGAYLFTNLVAGTYTVAFTPPGGYFFTASNVGNDASDSDPLTGTNRTAAVTLSGAQNETTIDAGFYQLASLSGAVRVDVDGDGVIDVEDTAGIAGVTISLLDAASNVVATATTSGSGDYAFSNLTPGSYTLVQTLPSGFTNTVDVLAPNDLRIPRTLASGQNSTGNIFYDARTGSVTAQNKVLYLSDPSQSLDRVDPVASGDGTLAFVQLRGAISVPGPVTFDAASSGLGEGVATVTVAHTTGAGTNRLLLVGVAFEDDVTDGAAVSGVTYGGTPLTLVTSGVSSQEAEGQLWALTAPASGTANVVVTLTGIETEDSVVVGVASFSGVDQSTPLGTGVSAIGSSTTPSVSVTSATNDLVFGFVSVDDGRTATVVAGQTERMTGRTETAADGVRGAACTKPGGAGSTTNSWTLDVTDAWVALAVAIKPALPSGVNVATFTQSPAFALPLNMAAGSTVLITNYVNVTSGSMPANPAITARLAAGGSTFLTLSNPTYNSGTGTLVWSGSLGGAVAISAGQAISLNVSNALSGVEFQIRYDSSTYPSKIILPTASIIAVPSVAVYDAAYPGGTPVTTSPITSQRYVRFTVTDPFGAYDITGAGLAINGPGTAGDVNVAVTDVQVVSSNAWSKTYEYVWPTIALSGSYSLTVTANEGTEGITASGATTEILYAASIGDFVWFDANNNGQQDGGELGLSNVVVRLYNTNNVVVGVATSSVTGAYAFMNLLPGSYTVGFTAPAGYLFTTPNTGNDNTDSDPLAGTNRTATVTLTSSQTDTSVDAGFVSAASIAGFVRVDLNGNGVVETGDTNGIVGVTVQLLDAGSNVVATTTTAANGAYSFLNLVPGVYTVRETDLGGWYSTTDVSAPNDNLIPVTLTIGQNSTGNIFHDTQRASIGDFVWNDLNGNGQQDGGAESGGLSNVVVRLYDTNSVVVGVTTSTVTGAYAFTSLAAGSYTLSFTPPANYFSTTSNVGNDATDSDPLAGTNRTALVTLASGQTDNSVDAGFYAAASIAGFVRIDLNGNGVAEAGDTNGIVGVTVQLLDAASNVVATATTAANGSYTFTSLRPGTYTVRETDLGGWYSTLDATAPNDNLIPVTLSIGQNSVGNIFHDTQRASIGDFVWNDLNGNGQQDGGAEANGLSNVVVRLYDTNSVVVGVTTSTVTGAYAFTSLAAGSYTLSFTPPANYLSTTSNVGNDATDSDPLAGTNRTAVVTLASGQTDNSVDAGFYAAASIAGFVRIDVNGNGVAEAGDTNGISGVTVQLLDAASNVVATATTAVNGSYTFTSLRPGTYTVRETDLGGWYSTLDITAPNDNLIPVTLAVGQNSTGNIFHDTQRASIGDFVWNDLNGNGQQDGGAEANGLSNVVVRLYDTNSVVVGVTTSTVTGAYAFTSLAAGSYTVSFTPPANYLSTTSKVGNDATDSDPLAGTNRTAVVTLASGQTDNSVDAGFYAAASITGFVRIDVNGNGVAEAGDTNGISGVTVQLLDAASNVVATATTDVNGSYTFTSLRPGTYTVRETDLGGWYSTLDITAPNDNLIPVTLAVGQNSTGNIFHDTQRASIGDFVWNDLNGNGQQDGGAESGGLSNVVVRLYDNGGSVVGVTTSTVTGAYAFTSLAAGSYTLSFTPPANYLSTTSNVGSDATDSDPLAGTNRTAVVTLTSGQTDNSVDAGFYAAASIAGFVRIDVNGNGVAEAGDTNGIVGVTVQLLDAASNVVATATTDVNGSYTFTSLRPGTYTVRETDLGGWYSTLDITAPNDNLIPVTLVIGQNSINNNFHDTQRASIGDFVWNDLNGNGQQEGGEPGFSNVVVRLYDTNSVVVGVTTSTVTGAYAFTSLAAGSYTLSFTPPANYLSTTSNVGNDATDSDPLAGTNRTAVVTLTSGQTDNSVDAGFYAAASIAGFVRIDVNGNGVAEAGDTNGISGVTIELLDAGLNVVATATTDANGSYTFNSLRPGTYTVRETDLGGWYSTLDITAPNDNLIPVTLSVGQNSAGNNFHDAQPASLGDRVWNDLDGDGSQEVFEPGIANVRVYVDSNASGAYDVGEPMTLTLADGSYQIGALFAGVYTARVDTATLPAGMTQTYDLNGALDHSALVTLNSNQTRDDVDFGYRATAVYAIRGQVRDDYDLNGLFSDPDLAVAGVEVTLYTDPNGDGDPADGAAIASTRTASNGSYAFNNLLSGAYVVVETDPVYSVSTADKVDANDNRIPVLIVNADVLDRDFLDAVDPSGYLYDVADGRIVPGGSISVAGPGADVLMDGSNGQYMFIATNNAPGTYTISVTPPPDYVLDLTRPAQPGSFDPTGGPDPTVLGSYESVTPPGFLVNYSAASNTYYYTFDLQPGDPPVINNNFPLKRIVLEVTGTVFYDLNRLTDSTVNGTGTDAGGLFANLVDPTTYMVIASVPVATNGTYRFTEAEGVLANTSYVVILTQTVQPVASVLTGATLPANWVSTGEHVGAGPGSDGMPDSWLQASTTADGVREVNFGIVSVPDITPVITATPNVMTGVTDYEIYVQCIELKGINTAGLITLRIPKDPRWVMLPGWNPTFTQLPVSGLPVQNPLWTHTEDADTHFFTTTSTITGSTQATFGFQARWNAGQTRGSYTISVAIVPGSGGEDRINNNNDSETVNYSF